ncbi:MAG: hypothetical protein ACREIC_27190 [Limisphaerales bacterium]
MKLTFKNANRPGRARRVRQGVVLASLSVALGWLSAPAALAQNDSSEAISNAMFEAASAVFSNAAVQASDLILTNDAASNGVAQAEEGTNEPASFVGTNLPAPSSIQPGPSESRQHWMMRQRAGAPGTNPPDNKRANAVAASATDADSRPEKPEYSTFRLITDRNIFDPNRVGGRSRGPSRKAPTVQSFALVGVMSYDKGTFAFFDGSSSDYRKAVKLSDSIAGFKVTNIGPNDIKLAAGTNHVELRVGMQLHREEGGDWIASSQAETYAASAAPSVETNTGSTTGGPSSDVLERLRKRREQE